VGHTARPQREYRLLRERLDGTVSGAPDSPALAKILALLFSADDVALARRLPLRLAPLEEISTRLAVAADELLDKLDDMARRGLVIDLEHDGRRWFALAPVAIGFFEFTFMRVRNEIPQAELARLFDQYMDQDDRFDRSLFRGPTQIGRSLVHEEALPGDDHTEILDWERASRLLRDASAVAVSLCACRHKAEHLGKACDKPQEVCLSLNFAAESLVRNGMARPLDTDEALAVLQQCKEAGLAQTGDNVRRKPTYICNCCGCCCEMIGAIKTFALRNAIVTSNWIVQIDPEKCRGCGECVEACPIDAVELVELPAGQEPRKQARRDEQLCLGCGVCYSACKFGAIGMKSRRKRVFTPESVFDRVALMAVERGKLAELIFDGTQRPSHRALGRIVALLERVGTFKAALAIKPLRSAFLRRAVRDARKRIGAVSEILD